MKKEIISRHPRAIYDALSSLGWSDEKIIEVQGKQGGIRWNGERVELLLMGDHECIIAFWDLGEWAHINRLVNDQINAQLDRGEGVAL